MILGLVCFAAQTECHASKSKGNNQITIKGNEDVRLVEEPRGKGKEGTRKRHGKVFHKQVLL